MKTKNRKQKCESATPCKRCQCQSHKSANCVTPVEQLPALGMVQDPLIRAVKKAYRSSHTYKIDELLLERSRWQRKVTLASNKLAAVEMQIREMCFDLAQAADGYQPESKKEND